MKEGARQTAYATRKLAHARDEGAASRALIKALAAYPDQPLAGYWPIRTEPDPRPAMSAHHGPLCLPVVVEPGQPLAFRRWHPGAAMEPGAFGAAIPQDKTEITPQILIVPLLAFDARGYRLGYGGGFYDRTLQGLRAAGPVVAIGFAYGAQQVDAVPTEPTDQPLDFIVTEDGLTAF